MDKKYTERIIDSVEIPGAKVDVIECDNLGGAMSASAASRLYYCEQMGVKLRYVNITTQGVPVMTDAGALYYRRGKFDVSLNSNLLQSAVTGAFTKETLVKPKYVGKGVLTLEPSFAHYWVIRLDNSSIVINQSLYYASVGDIKLDLVAQKNISTALFVKDGLFQLRLSGTGIVVLEIPAPKSEIKQIQITPDNELCVDGNFVLVREESVTMTVTTNTKGVLSSGASGEGLLQKYSGKGLVWMAPTAPFYRKLSNGMPISNKNSNN